MALGVALLVGVALTGGAAAAAPSGFVGSRPVTLRDYLPGPSDVEGYSEQWSFSHELTGGGSLSVQVVVSNAGVGDGKGGLKVDLRLPDGTRRKVRRRCRVRGELKGEHAVLRCAGLTVRSTLGGYTATLSKGKLRFEAAVAARTPPWRPGDGQVRYDDEGEQVYELLVAVPRGELSGSLKLGKRTEALSGLAFADHSRSTLGPHLVAKRWLRFKRLKPDLSLLFAAWQAPSGERFGYVLAADASGRLLASANPLIEERALKPAPNRAAYLLPHSLTLTAKQPEGSLQVRVQRARLVRTKDLLGGLNALERVVAKRFSDPFGYSLRGQISVRWEHGGKLVHELSVEDGYLVEHINP